MPGKTMASQVEMAEQRKALSRLIGVLFPGAQLENVGPLSESRFEREAGTTKLLGYGNSLLVTILTTEGERKRLVFRTSRPDNFGHDRRSDRACDALLAFDTFKSVPRQVRAVDVGAIGADGALYSLRGKGEFYVLTDYAEGRPYADDLWHISRERSVRASDRTRCDALADYLVNLHAEKIDQAGAYRRAIRDLIGHGEGIFGLVDNYPDDVPAAPLRRLQSIERSCLDWRFRLRGREGRLARTHGDFHPFNILFDDKDNLSVLDASRGCQGDPADDLTCLSINYLFFAMESGNTWKSAFGELWERFWVRYLDSTADRELLEVAPPYLAWRALVLANPLWYPNARPETRDALLGLAERALHQGRFDLEDAGRLFA